MAEVVEAFATDLTGADPGTPGQGLHNLQLVFDMDANDSCPVDSACETKVIAAALALVQSQKAQLEQLGVRQVRDAAAHHFGCVWLDGRGGSFWLCRPPKTSCVVVIIHPDNPLTLHCLPLLLAAGFFLFCVFCYSTLH